MWRWHMLTWHRVLCPRSINSRQQGEWYIIRRQPGKNVTCVYTQLALGFWLKFCTYMWTIHG
ncbi:hypothetical protein M5D96_003882, partial [Drosophila gunungcola]